jgi:glycosyltransferase involved in cell wall biosynthesis
VRILFIYQFCTLGGVEAVLRNRLEELAAHGVAVSLAFLDDLGGSDTFRRVPGIRLSVSRRELARRLAEERFDFIVPIDTPEAYSLLRGATNRGVIVTEVHSNHPPNLQYLHALASTGTRAVLTPSRFQRELILREFPAVGRAEIPVHIVPNPIDVRRFRFVAPRAPAARPVVGWVGRLEPQKNWRQFVALASALTHAGEDLDFVMVGGERAPTAVKETLRSLVTVRELVDRFRWVSRLPYERMPAFYSLLAASGGCLVPTSLVEPFGMTVVEAMACGSPVVAPRIDAFTELIEEGVSGLHFPSGDVVAATERVRQLLGDATLRERLRCGEGERIATHFTAERSVARLLEVLASLDGATPASRRGER